MAKRISFSFPEWVERDIIEKCPYNNKSEWVNELLIKGFEAKQKESIWLSADPREKPLNKIALEARRASGPLLSLLRASDSVFSSLIEQERPVGLVEGEA
jgi:Arc/MetJ-type ribon-helix-helix transcriptional regulator